jgi:hypothetical protein
MRKIIYSIVALGAIAISSCSSDPCEGKSATTLCSGKGTLASDGTNCKCNCNTGYEGTSCATETADKYVGTWNGTESYTGTTPGTITPILVISKTATLGTIKIDNFSDLGLTINAEATVSSDNKLTLKSKNLTSSYTLTSGSGTFSTSTSGKSVVSISYIITEVSSSKTSTYTGTWTKQ